MLGYRFRRQFSIGGFIPDFYCPKLKLDLEIDGESHFLRDGPEHDRLRTTFLERMGLQVIRIPNNEIMRNLDGVLAFLSDLVRRRALELGTGVESTEQ
jgi:very-short-patch-repair endonuclease